jgi:Domain of unknown function (DUF892)
VGLLGENEAQNLLQQTLNEEKETDENLTKLSTEINVDAMSSVSGKSSVQDEDESAAPRPRGKSRSARA